MSLVECVECSGVVSQEAAACPHCGHPNPAARGTGKPESSPADQHDEVTEAPRRRPLLPVVLWVLGFFVIGVALNGAVEAAGIAISGNFDWGYSYRPTWFRVLVPYAVAAIGGFIGLARQKRGTRHPFGYISLGLSLVLAGGIGLVLMGVANEAGPGDNAPVVTQTTISQSALTSTQLTTSTTSLLDSWVYCLDDSQLTKDTDCSGEAISFDQWEHCLDNFREDSDCDGWVRLSWLVFDYYWVEEWLPLWEEVAEYQNKDEARAQILCQMEIGQPTAVAQRTLSWESSPLRDIATPWLEEMEVALAACSNGEWRVVDDSLNRVNAYRNEVCPLIDREETASGNVWSLDCGE